MCARELWRWVPAAAGATIMAVAAGACSLGTDLDDAPRGALQLEARDIGIPAWSPDSREIYYLVREGAQVTPFSLFAVDVESTRRRTLVEFTGWNTGGEVVRTQDSGENIYFAFGAPPHGVQYEIRRTTASGGEVGVLATDAGVPWFEVAGGSGHLAYVGPDHDADTLYVVDGAVSEPRVTRRLSGVGRATVIGVAPLGDAVVYQSGSAAFSVQVQDSVSQLIVPQGPDTSWITAQQISPTVRWEGVVPHILVGSFAQTEDGGVAEVHEVSRDGIRGDALAVFPGAVGSPRYMAHSIRGDVAAWVPTEVLGPPDEPTGYVYHLYIHRPMSGSSWRGRRRPQFAGWSSHRTDDPSASYCPGNSTSSPFHRGMPL